MNISPIANEVRLTVVLLRISIGFWRVSMGISTEPTMGLKLEMDGDSQIFPYLLNELNLIRSQHQQGFGFSFPIRDPEYLRLFIRTKLDQLVFLIISIVHFMTNARRLG
jgi:hypothetical protein